MTVPLAVIWDEYYKEIQKSKKSPKTRTHCYQYESHSKVSGICTICYWQVANSGSPLDPSDKNTGFSELSND